MALLQRQQFFTEWRKHFGTCSLEGVFGVPKQFTVGPAKAKQLFTEGRKQVPVGTAAMAVPCQKSSSGLVLDDTSAVFKQDGTCFEEEVFGEPRNRSGGTRSGWNLFCGRGIFEVPRRGLGGNQAVFLEGRENPAMSLTDGLAPLCDDEFWLSEAVLDAEGGTLGDHKVEAHCLSIYSMPAGGSGRRNRATQMMKALPGMIWPIWAHRLAVLLLSRRNTNVIWLWHETPGEDEEAKLCRESAVVDRELPGPTSYLSQKRCGILSLGESMQCCRCSVGEMKNHLRASSASDE
eukprot:2804619-Amphidinium_carterae.1